VAEAARQVASWHPDPAELGGFGVPPPGEEVEVGPDAVLVWTYPAQAAELAEALREAGYAGRLFLDMIAAGELFLPREAAGLQGATLVFTPTPVADQRIGSAPALAARKTWFDAYTARFGTYHLHASFAADALLTVADAVRRAEAVDRETLRDRIEATRLDGMTGQIRFTNQQHSGLSTGALVTLTASGDRWQ
jgi:branched-chain amino acid transport system substrate-binding protein